MARQKSYRSSPKRSSSRSLSVITTPSQSSYTRSSRSGSYTRTSSSKSSRRSSCRSNVKKLTSVEKVIQAFIKECDGLKGKKKQVTQDCVVNSLARNHNIPKSEAKKWVNSAIKNGFFTLETVRTPKDEKLKVLTPTKDMSFGETSYKGQILEATKTMAKWDKDTVKREVRSMRNQNDSRFVQKLFDNAWDSLCENNIIRSKSGSPGSIQETKPNKKKPRKTVVRLSCGPKKVRFVYQDETLTQAEVAKLLRKEGYTVVNKTTEDTDLIVVPDNVRQASQTALSGYKIPVKQISEILE